MIELQELKKKRKEALEQNKPSDEEIRKVEASYMAGRPNVTLLYNTEQACRDSLHWWRTYSTIKDEIFTQFGIDTYTINYMLTITFTDQPI